MKKFLFLVIALVFSCNIAKAESNFLNAKWWETATVQDVQNEISAGANVNAKNNNGGTVLMYAVAQSKNPDVIAALIKAGADVNARAEMGITALFVAVEAKNRKITDMLLRKVDYTPYCTLTSSTSIEIAWCVDRMKVYAQKESKLPSCLTNIAAVLEFSILGNALNIIEDKDTVLMGILDMGANYNCSAISLLRGEEN